MEAAKVEWDRIESVFVKDDVYESINAPQWVDLLLSSPSPSSSSSLHDDVAWFCRPDCKHPTTADDFLHSTPPSPPFKLLRSASVSKLIGLVDWTRREPILKRRGVVPHSENQDSNFSSPSPPITYLNKASIKSSAQKSKEDEDDKEEDYSDILLASHDNIKPSQSAKDLIGGSKDLFGKIAEFCNELKKMASHAKHNDHNLSVHSPDRARIVLGPCTPLENRSDRPKERLPLLEVVTAPERSIAKGTLRKNKIKRANEAENIPVSLDLNNMKLKEEKKVLPIRTNPPTPQGFSASRDPIKTGASSKSPKSRFMKRETTEEMGLKKRVKEEDGDILGHGGRDGRSLDVFWLFKPCALSS